MLDHNELTRLLPKATFQTIIDRNQIYVDKTALIHTLAQNSFAQLLTRPRRFGKSTLVSVLHELYSHGVKPFKDTRGVVHESYFKGLAIEKLWQDDNTYQVIHIDFSSLASCEDDLSAIFKIEELYDIDNYFVEIARFNYSLRNTIVKYIKKYGYENNIDIKSSDPLALYTELVNKLVQEFGNGSVVLLIDEYDFHLTHIPNNFSKKAVKAYSSFVLGRFAKLYRKIKADYSPYRKVFITGITKIKDSAFYSIGHNITDISLDPTYGAIVGFTRDEIRKYFVLHLQYCASHLYHIDEDKIKPCHIERLLNDMATWYDGYYFESNTSCHVFSTISILKFFSQHDTFFNTFWYNTGGTPALLRTNINKILSLCEDKQDFFENITVSYNDFKYPVSYQDMHPATLLYQTGYFTLAKPFDNSSVVSLKIPNHELKSSLALLACSYLFKEKIDELGKGRLSFSMSIDDLFDYLYKIIDLTDYDHNPLTQESSVTLSYNMFFSGNRQYRVTVDSHSHKDHRYLRGLRVDIDDLHTFVFEFKFNKKDSNESDNKLLNEAIVQMQDKDYLKIEGREVRGFAVIYNDEKRKLTELQEVHVQSKSI